MAQTFPHAFVRASDATNTLTHKHLGVGFKILMLGVDFTHAHAHTRAHMHGNYVCAGSIARTHPRAQTHTRAHTPTDIMHLQVAPRTNAHTGTGHNH